MAITRALRTLLAILLLGSCLNEANASKRIAVLIAGGVCGPGSPFARFGSDLQAPPNDVRLMADLLEGRYGFARSNISIVGVDERGRRRMRPGCRFLSDRATRDAILQAVTELQRSAGPDDYVVLFYSGHGAPLFDPDEGIDVGTLVTYEGTKERAIRYSDLERRLDACPSRHVTLIVDACFSGLFAKPGPRRANSLDELRDLGELSLQDISKSLPIDSRTSSPTITPAHAGSGPIQNSLHHFTTLSACDEDEQTQEARFTGSSEPFAISEFTWALCRTLWQNQSILTLEELHRALTLRLTVQKQRQTPQFRRGRQRSELIGPPVWTSDMPSLPLLGPDTLSVGRLGGISLASRFREESDRKGVADPRGTILRIRSLDWYRADLTPAAGKTRHKYVVPANGQ